MIARNSRAEKPLQASAVDDLARCPGWLGARGRVAGQNRRSCIRDEDGEPYEARGQRIQHRADVERVSKQATHSHSVPPRKKKEELSIAELTEGVAISQSALSQHLTKLRKGGIISVRRAGHNSFYRLADPRAAQLAIALIRS